MSIRLLLALSCYVVLSACSKTTSTFLINAETTSPILEIEYQDTQKYLDQLDRSILAKAFRGELVEQDPNDEPASVLLDRIRAEREQLSQSGKTSRKTNRKPKQLTMELP